MQNVKMAKIEEEKMSGGGSPTRYFQSRNLKETMERIEKFQAEKVKQMEHVLLVGFHHLVGS